MTPLKATAAVLVASALWFPLAADGIAPTDPAGDSMVIQVQVPARTGAPTTPAPTPTAIPDATPPRSGSLPATGVEVALWGAALAAAAVVIGAVARSRRRRRA